MNYYSYATSIKDELSRTGRPSKNLRIKTIMKYMGYSRRSQLFIDEFNSALQQVGLTCRPPFDIQLPIDAKIAISLLEAPAQTAISNSNSVAATPATTKNSAGLQEKTIQVKQDFFYYLFDFGSEQEYEQFQACLDSNQPIALFLVPQEEDFFSDLVARVLIYELLRKNQYQGKSAEIKMTRSSLGSVVDPDEEASNSASNYGQQANIVNFNLATMTNVLLGTDGIDLLDSEKFDEKFEDLSTYANKFNQDQFFITFQCPSWNSLQQNQRIDLFGQLVNKVSGKIPFTFVLQCKYPNESAIEAKEDIYTHFRLLLEMPQLNIDEDDVSLVDYFLALQKAQAQAEAHLFLKISSQSFDTLYWGYESNEHIYLKYFAIETLQDCGFDLSEIICEVAIQTKSKSQEVGLIEEEDVRRKPDVYLKDKILVEVETLRGKGFANQHIYLDLIGRLIDKSIGWGERLEEIWLVTPGFEVARNYYQLKKTQEILSEILRQRWGEQLKILVMVPDYENHIVVPVDFSEINYPKLECGLSGSSTSTTSRKNTILPTTKSTLNFESVKGLWSEKQKMEKILALQRKGLSSDVSGILLFGLPGCGKTLLANAFANESERYFFKFSPADVQSMWIGRTQKNIRDIFRQAKKRSPSVLFIDELDSIGFSREEMQAHTDQKATINQLLIELNNLADSDVIVIAATNYLSGIDRALKRSGRFDWKIPIFPPNIQERIELFTFYLEKIGINLETIDCESLAQQSVRFTSSDIELVCKEIKRSVILEEISSDLNTETILTFIRNVQNGGLTLDEEQVRKFLEECLSLSVKSPKLGVLQQEWGL